MRALLFLLTLVLAPPMAFAAAAAPPAPAERGEGASDQQPSGFVVYFPEDEKAQAPALPPVAPGDPDPATLALVTVVFLGGGCLWLRYRSSYCPRCQSRLARFEVAEGEPGPRTAGLEHLEVLGCLPCGNLLKRRYGALAGPDSRCPRCGKRTKVSKYDVLDRSGYLVWGKVRVHEECASCSHAVSYECATPPLEAPRTARPRRRMI